MLFYEPGCCYKLYVLQVPCSRECAERPYEFERFDHEEGPCRLKCVSDVVCCCSLWTLPHTMCAQAATMRVRSINCTPVVGVTYDERMQLAHSLLSSWVRLGSMCACSSDVEHTLHRCGETIFVGNKAAHEVVCMNRIVPCPNWCVSL